MHYITKADFDRMKEARRKGIAKSLSKSVTIGKRQATGGDVTDVRENVSLLKFLRGIHFNMWDGAEVEKRATQERNPMLKALGETVGTLGGVVVPTIVAGTLLPALREVAKIRELPIEVRPTDDAYEISYPYEDTDPTISWGTENSTISEDTSMDYGQRFLHMKRMQCFIKTSRELIRHASINMEENIRTRLGSAAGLEEDRVILEGLGGTRPQGIYYNPRVHSTDLGAALSADNIKDADYQLRNANVQDVNGWLMHPRTANDIAHLKDANGRYTFPTGAGPGIVGTGLSNLWGVPVKQTTKMAITNMPDSNESYMVAADWRQLLLGDGPMEIEVTTIGGDAFVTHQLWIKLVKYVGVLPKNPAAFLVIKGIITT